ncbi:hypothetical protein HUB98_06205 [Paenibacillus barcinonensis]|uniref:Uncharacterized protein n=1 Tax=Paenibacillus barcinonensis TaxID=198119 RepID=A0A2V4VWC1_PAEBA|nr:hypothetical protein [Paenibacillus barcinonensis]PYE51606.1 hypothetical protein DFQ00_102401 [Paenibacillus barcinonensis]QKS55973.1 hypothetical protein HUB98_06205 [Paenibacillus barcinonensis]
MKIDKFVKQVTKKLDAEGVKYEVIGDEHSFAISPTCTIHTNNCTIEINKNRITVNEKAADDIEDMIDLILEVEYYSV